MTLTAFLTDKKIDPKQMQAADPALWEELQALFNQMSPASFDQQKKFRFNRWRQQYPLAFDPAAIKPKAKSKGKLPLKMAKSALKTAKPLSETSSGSAKPLPRKKPKLTPPVVKKQEDEVATEDLPPTD